MNVTTFGGLKTRIVGGTDGAGAGSGPVVVLLHGFGAPGDDLVPLGQVFGQALDRPGHDPIRFVFPEAPLALGPEYAGGRAWWSIDFQERLIRRMRGDHGERDVPKGLPEARAMLDAALGEIHLQLAPTRLALGGFSQGSMLALDVALHTAHPLAGLVLLSTTHLAGDEWASRFVGRTGLPVFMSHGKQDELLPFGISEKLRDLLVEAGLPVEWVPFVGGHGIPPKAVEGAVSFLQRVLA